MKTCREARAAGRPAFPLCPPPAAGKGSVDECRPDCSPPPRRKTLPKEKADADERTLKRPCPQTANREGPKSRHKRFGNVRRYEARTPVPPQRATSGPVRQPPPWTPPVEKGKGSGKGDAIPLSPERFPRAYSHPPPRARQTLTMEDKRSLRAAASCISLSNRERSASSTSRYEE